MTLAGEWVRKTSTQTNKQISIAIQPYGGFIGSLCLYKFLSITNSILKSQLFIETNTYLTVVKMECVRSVMTRRYL